MTVLQGEKAIVQPNTWHGPANNESETTEEKIRLVLVDDDDEFRESARAELADLGFDVVALRDDAPMFAYFDQGRNADLIILDWNLPSGSGVHQLSQLRCRGIRLPVVFLTGVSATTYESLALDCGALDFIDKARGIHILAKRIGLIVGARNSLSDESAANIVHRGKLVLRLKASRAYWIGVDVKLTVMEFKIVQLLVSHVSDFVTYRAIYDRVHHEGFIAGSGQEGYRTNVRSSVKRIRNKFRAVDAEFLEIENFSGFGYRWRGVPPGVT